MSITTVLLPFVTYLLTLPHTPYTFNTDKIQSPPERRRRSSALFSQSAYTERLIPPLIDEGTPLPSGNGGCGETDRNKDTGRRSLFTVNRLKAVC
jgi:hypothetical protein